jgi:hypothetical protein
MPVVAPSSELDELHCNEKPSDRRDQRCEKLTKRRRDGDGRENGQDQLFEAREVVDVGEFARAQLGIGKALLPSEPS